MKIAHISDIHFSPEHLHWIRRAMEPAIAGARQADLAIFSGDLLDRATPLHDPSATAAIGSILEIAERAPVVVLQGTFSHDRPGSLDVLKRIPTAQPILVADEVGHWWLYSYGWDRTLQNGENPRAAICAMPSLNRADPEVQEEGAATWVRRKLAEFEQVSKMAHRLNIPSILVAHGTVSGSTTESNHALVSPDHEFGIDALLASGADAILLGHIHKHQSWIDSRQVAAYAGSLARLVHGDHEPKGWLLWNVKPGAVSFALQEVPTRRLVEIEFDGPPDLGELREIAAGIEPEDSVRVRYKIDQEHAGQVNKAAIRALFAKAERCLVQPTVLAVQSVRAAGMCRVQTTEEKLRYFLRTTQTKEKDTDQVVHAYARLCSEDPQKILSSLT